MLWHTILKWDILSQYLSLISQDYDLIVETSNKRNKESSNKKLHIVKSEYGIYMVKFKN